MTNVLAPYEFTNVPEQDLVGAVTAIGLTLEAVPIDATTIRETGFSADLLFAYWREEDLSAPTTWARRKLLGRDLDSERNTQAPGTRCCKH